MRSAGPEHIDNIESGWGDLTDILNASNGRLWVNSDGMINAIPFALPELRELVEFPRAR